MFKDKNRFKKRFIKKRIEILKKRDNQDSFQIRYSQNFLRDPKLVKKLIDKSSIELCDLVYEIGSGKGIITEQLAKQSAKVIGIEKDKKLYEKLRQKFIKNNKIEIKYGDFLQYNLPQEKYKIFSNIPFNLTADIIKKITSSTNPPEDTYLIIQKEAAIKFAGSPYGKERQDSLLLKPWFEMEIIYRFHQTDFYPIPHVDIVLLRIKKRGNPLVKKDQSQLYRDFIVYAFNQWKLDLKKALKKIFTYKQFIRLAKDLGFSKTAKPTDLSFEQWLGLFNYFLVGVEQYKKELVCGAEGLLKHQQARLQKIHRTKGDYTKIN